MRIHSSVLELIGNTPLVEVKNIEKQEQLPARIALKLEAKNPGGSVKDRVALNMILKAEQEGLIKEGTTIIEATSGNTGIGLAMVGARRGYDVVIVMPDSMSVERRNLLKAFGARLELTPGAKGMAGAIERANELAEELGDVFIAGQFENQANPEIHYMTTGPEIWNDTDGTIDIFVSGVGTGGTISGVGKYLKEENANIKIVAVEPAKSAVLTGHEKGAHGIQGIGAGFIPNTLDTEIYDEIMPIEDEQAYQAGRQLAQMEGILVGISAGAAFAAAKELAKRPENKGKLIVALLPDTGDRYLSTKLFQE